MMTAGLCAVLCLLCWVVGRFEDWVERPVLERYECLYRDEGADVAMTALRAEPDLAVGTTMRVLSLLNRLEDEEALDGQRDCA